MPSVERAGAPAACDKVDEAQRAMAAVTREDFQALPRTCECVLGQTLWVRAESASVLWAEVSASILFAHRSLFCGPLSPATGTSRRLLEAKGKADFRDELRALVRSLKR